MKRLRAARKDCWAVETAQGRTHLPCIYEDQNLLEHINARWAWLPAHNPRTQETENGVPRVSLLSRPA